MGRGPVAPDLTHTEPREARDEVRSQGNIRQ